MSQKSKFFKNRPRLICHDHHWFLRIWKAVMCSFLTRMMIYKKYTIILFCIHEIGMPFETPLAPVGLHFYFGPSGVKWKIAIYFFKASLKNQYISINKHVFCDFEDFDYFHWLWENAIFYQLHDQLFKLNNDGFRSYRRFIPCECITRLYSRSFRNFTKWWRHSWKTYTVKAPSI